MEIRYVRVKRIFKSEDSAGKALLAISVVYPVSGTAADRFIFDAAEGCLKWAESVLLPELQRRFLALSDPRKRFLPAARYLFDCRVRSESPLSVTVNAVLDVQGGERDSATWGYTFAEDGTGPLPPSAFLDRARLRKHRDVLRSGYYVQDGALFALGTGQTKPTLICNKIKLKIREMYICQ